MMGRMLSDLRAVVRRFLSHDGFLLAAGLSYSFLLCLAPLALLFFSGVGYLLQSHEIAGYVLETVRSLFPGYGSEVLQALVTLAQERRVTGVVGGVGLAIFATQLFSMTRTVVNVAFRVEKRRGMFHGFPFDAFAPAVPGLLAAAVSAGILALVTLGSPALRSAEPPPLLGIRWARADAPYRRRGDPRRRRRAVRPPERLANHAPLPGLGRARRAARRRRAAGPGRGSPRRRLAPFDQPMEAPRPAPADRGESADCGAGLEPMTEGRARAPGP